jgi:hypothetical protein
MRGSCYFLIPNGGLWKMRDYNNNIFINCSWVVTRWQYTFTHKQYTEQHK